MHRFYVRPQDVETKAITLDRAESKHAYSVMRLRKADEILCFDGIGNEYTGVVDALSATQGVIAVKKKVHYDPPVFQLTLAAAIPKQSRFDEIVDNATQLGVHAIIPLVTERTVVKSAVSRLEHKQERWHKIAVEAAKQCGCAYVPQVFAAESFSRAVARAGSFDAALIPALDPEAVSLKKVLRAAPKPGKVIVFIGPEGDFSPDEITEARKNTCRVVSLGVNVLRCATAATMVLSVLRYEWEN